MSAPSAGSPNGSPVPGYYPDPSIPGYIRYWNGSSWAPGTSRPAPGPGEPAPAPPAEVAGLPAARTGDPTPDEPEAEEDDRDEIDLGRARAARESLPEVRRRAEIAAPDPAAGQGVTDWDDPRRLHGGAPDAGSAWQADTGRQPEFGDDRQDLAWSSPGPATPAPEAPPVPEAGGVDPRAGWGAPADEAPTAEPPPPDHTVGIRMPRRQPGASGHGVQNPDAVQPPAPGHTVGIPMPRPEDAHGQGAQGQPGHGAHGRPEPTVGLRRSDVLGQGGDPAADPYQGGHQAATGYQPPPAPGDLYGGQGHAAAQQAQRAPHGAPSGPAWAQQVQHLAEPGAAQAPAHAPGSAPIPGQPRPGAEGAAPWRPPAADPFADAAQDARPAGLGRRFVARLIDGLIVGAVVGAVATPFVGMWTAHIQDQIAATRQAGVTRTIWLVDGTTGVYLAVILGAFLLFGLLYEALPTAKWGRTLGKKLVGIQVLDIERQDSPGFGASLRRWLTCSVLSLLVIGVLNVIWCLFDRPWRQCWHDKVARTFVAGR